MKTILSILLCFGFLISCKSNENHVGVVYEGQCIAMPEYYREITGFDSVQIVPKLRDSINQKEVLEANFCYPNKYNVYKYDSYDTIVYWPDSVYFYSSQGLCIDTENVKQ